MLCLYFIKSIVYLYSIINNKLFYGFLLGLLVNRLIMLSETKKNSIDFTNDKRIKELFGTYIYYKLLHINNELTPKITGMLIDLDNKYLLELVNNDNLLVEKYNEALEVLEEYNLIN